MFTEKIERMTGDEVIAERTEVMQTIINWRDTAASGNAVDAEPDEIERVGARMNLLTNNLFKAYKKGGELMG